jgi:cysteinyl-tRNA synthetase
LKKFDAEVVRFFIVRAHYRSRINYSDAHLEDAKGALTRLYTALRGTSVSSPGVDWGEPHAKRFKAAMDDDFGTPEAVAVLFDLAGRVNSGENALAPQLRALGGLLGLLQRDSSDFLQGGKADAWVVERIAAREVARKRRDFAAADRIRKELLDQGVVLEDGAKGTTWRRA